MSLRDSRKAQVQQGPSCRRVPGDVISKPQEKYAATSICDETKGFPIGIINPNIAKIVWDPLEVGRKGKTAHMYRGHLPTLFKDARGVHRSQVAALRLLTAWPIESITLEKEVATYRSQVEVMVRYIFHETTGAHSKE